VLQQRPNTFAQTILSLSFFACDKAADHTFRLARQPDEDQVRRSGLDQLGWPCHLLLQRCPEVRDHGDGLAHLLLNPVEKEFLAVGRNVVENLWSGPVGDEPLSSPEL
jgi:hypothetical protein